MQINRNNYEAFFLDYWEKNLPPQQVAELLVFLEENPDLKEEFEIFENVSLVPDNDIQFNQKSSLKKPALIPTENITEINFDEYMVAKLEGDISENDAIELTAFMELNPKLKLHYNLYRSAVLIPDPNLRFEDKRSLKKTAFFIAYQSQIRFGISIAASIIILLGLYFGFPGKQDPKIARERNSLVVPDINAIQPEIIPAGNKMAIIVSRKSFVDQVTISNREPSQNDNQNFFAISELQARSVNTIEIEGGADNSMDFIISKVDSQPETLEIALADKQPRQSSFFKRFVYGIAGKLINTENIEKKSFFEMTVEGYNLIADKEVMVKKEVDESGRIIAYSLDGENIPFPRFNKGQEKE
ncbi:MAG: hypothetical protein R2764_11145 [Bacteroidales bacterium]